MRITENDVLVVVDVQNDFCPGGPMAVPEGDGVVDVINRLIDKFDHLVYSRDWHPSDHVSFSDEPEFRDGSWPRHCVQHTPGAEFYPDLRVPSDALVVNKAANPEVESYSAFGGTGLAQMLKERGIQRVFVTGLATDYCVKGTALDAVDAGFETVLVEDAARGIAEETVREAYTELERAGVQRVMSQELKT